MRFVGLAFLCTLGAVEGICSNNLAGVENNGVCCLEECGECGGRGCNSLEGARENCCTGTIEESGVLCSVSGLAPCIVDNAILCDVDEIGGIQGDGVCCSIKCGTCGGSGCNGRPGGADECCRGTIIENGTPCRLSGSAPCVSSEESLCDVDEIPGIQGDGVCCSSQCGSCGGPGCNGRPGGADECCRTTILENGTPCGVSGSAPCVSTDESVCDVDEIPGIQGDGVCCSSQCGSCGGPGCSGRPGGADECCRGTIIENATPCGISGSAPCVTTEESLCDVDEIPGIQGDGVCCSSQCGSCGGPGCNGRPGGADECCRTTILENGTPCGVSGSAPCVSTDESVCDVDEIPGIQGDGVCCSSQCGSCGGPGCSGRPGGADECCMGTIIENGTPCGISGSAPCVTTEESICDIDEIAGIQGDGVCCSSQCGSCGGPGCSGRPGGADECCRGTIIEKGTPCGISGSAPCVSTGNTGDDSLECLPLLDSADLGSASVGAMFRASFVVRGGTSTVYFTTEDEDILVFPDELETGGDVIVVGLAPDETLDQYTLVVEVHDSDGQSATCEATLEVVADPDISVNLREVPGEANSTYEAELVANTPPTTFLFEEGGSGNADSADTWTWEDAATGGTVVMEVDNETGLPSRLEQAGSTILLEYNETALLSVMLITDTTEETVVVNLPLDEGGNDISIPAGRLLQATSLGTPSPTSVPTSSPTLFNITTPVSPSPSSPTTPPGPVPQPSITGEPPTVVSPTASSPTDASPTISAPTAPSPVGPSPTAPSPTDSPPIASPPTSSTPTASSPTVESPTASSPTVEPPTAPSPTDSPPTVESPTVSEPTMPSPTGPAPTAPSPTGPSPTHPTPTNQPEPPSCNPSPPDSTCEFAADIATSACSDLADPVCDKLVKCKTGKTICRGLSRLASICPVCVAGGCAAVLTGTCIKRFQAITRFACELVVEGACEVAGDLLCADESSSGNSSSECEEDDEDDNDGGRVGGFVGDPHLRSFDGRRYGCQGRGEFVLVQAAATATEVQARYKGYAGSTSFTVTTGVVARESDSSVVQITYGDDGARTTLVDGNIYDDAATMAVGVALEVTPERVTMTFAGSGLEVIAIDRFGYMDVQVFAPFTVATTGLLGNNNGIYADDWETPTGDSVTFTSPSGPTITEGTNYCTTYWCTSESQSIFTYTAGLDDHATYDLCDEPYVAPSFPSAVPADVAELCGDNAECTFDALLAGTEVAEATLRTGAELEALQEAIGGICGSNTFGVDGAPPCTACPTGEISASGATTCTLRELWGLDIAENIAAAIASDAAGGFAGPLTLIGAPEYIDLTERDAGSFTLGASFSRNDGLVFPSSTAIFLYIENAAQPDDFVRGQAQMTILADDPATAELEATITDVPTGPSRLFLSFVVMDTAEAFEVTGADTVFAFEMSNNACDPSLTITLEWSDDSSDVDLYVTEPGDVTVYYADRSGAVGSLDNDDTSGFGPENYVIYSGLDQDVSPVIGEYEFLVRLYTGSTDSWRITVRMAGEVVAVEEGDFVTSSISDVFTVSIAEYDPSCGAEP